MISLRSTSAGTVVDATTTTTAVAFAASAVAAAAAAAANICVLSVRFIVRKVAHLTGCCLFTR